MMRSEQLLFIALSGIALAQFPPEPKGITVLRSKFHENVTISYKQPNICETTPGVKSYAGYVHLPPGTLDDGKGGETQDYPINTFFWFFEARKAPENAPLSIWLNGGPGGSSIMGAFEELGPCFVTSDSKETYINPWSWNNEVNMLFLDQPNQVGFSYDVPTNGSFQAVEREDGKGVGFLHAVPTNFTDDNPPVSNLTYYPGTFASQKLSMTSNSTASAAHALWHFAQTWFFEFPYYKPEDNGISLWAESYGGHYGPGIFEFFQQQNDKIRDGTSKEKDAHYLHLNALGIVDGLIDIVVQGPSFFEFAYNNTYGIPGINETEYNNLTKLWNEPGGCKDQLLICQAALEERDSGNYTRNSTKICSDVEECAMFGVDTYTGRAGLYDIAHPYADPFPPPLMFGYFTQEHVLEALGVPVNFSFHSNAVAESFNANFDLIRGGFIDAIAYLLDSGVKVHMMYGDRDFICNWMGGEAASLAVPYSRKDEFAAAGYSPLITPEGVSGMTRQVGNFSFTRVFQAGHEVPAYQPAAAYEIFMRSTFHRDIATGLIPVTDALATVGPKDTRHIRNVPPERPKEKCYILKPMSCTLDTWMKVVSGNVTVKDWYVVEEDGDGIMSVDEEAQIVLGHL